MNNFFCSIGNTGFDWRTPAITGGVQLIGVLLAAWISWWFYNRKRKIETIREEVETLNILSSYIASIFEDLINLKEQLVLPRSKESREYTQLLDKLKVIITKYHSGADFNLLDAEAKKLFNLFPLRYVSKTISCRILGFDLADKSSFIVNYGNQYFLKIIIKLQKQLKILEDIIENINFEVKSGANGARFSCRIDDSDALDKVDAEIINFSYCDNLNQNLLKIVDTCLFFAELIIEHLQAFMELYSKRHAIFLNKNKLNLAIPSADIKQKNHLKASKDFVSGYQLIRNIPEYKQLEIDHILEWWITVRKSKKEDISKNLELFCKDKKELVDQGECSWFDKLLIGVVCSAAVIGLVSMFTKK